MSLSPPPFPLQDTLRASVHPHEPPPYISPSHPDTHYTSDPPSYASIARDHPSTNNLLTSHDYPGDWDPSRSFPQRSIIQYTVIMPPPETTGHETIFDELPLYEEIATPLAQAPREVAPPPYQYIEGDYDLHATENPDISSSNPPTPVVQFMRSLRIYWRYGLMHCPACGSTSHRINPHGYDPEWSDESEAYINATHHPDRINDVALAYRELISSPHHEQYSPMSNTWYGYVEPRRRMPFPSQERWRAPAGSSRVPHLRPGFQPRVTHMEPWPAPQGNPLWDVIEDATAVREARNRASYNPWADAYNERSFE